MTTSEPSARTGFASTLKRSFDVYYRDVARTQRMDALNREFVSPGDLTFDIGAHIGDRTGSFLRLGARVVTVEPQPRVFRALRLLYGTLEEAELRCEAIGAEAGALDLFLNTDNPTISTASPDLISAAQQSAQWQGQVWDRKIRVPVTTLDLLIRKYGRPSFIKIDVEGHEAEVLKGLSTSVAALSFEFTTIQRDVAQNCLSELSRLGAYEFSMSFGEDHAFSYADWVDPDTVRSTLSSLPEDANSGDVFARLK